MIHACITFIISLIFILIKLPLAIVFVIPAFYFGREHAQAEYRYIEMHGKKRAECSWSCGFLPEAWNAKACLDCFLPVLASGLAVCFACTLKWL